MQVQDTVNRLYKFFYIYYFVWHENALHDTDRLYWKCYWNVDHLYRNVNHKWVLMFGAAKTTAKIS